jgi:hypothetical protein
MPRPRVALLAATIVRTLKYFEQRSRSFELRGVFWYSWHDKARGGAICDRCGHARVRTTGTAPPATRFAGAPGS